MSVSAGEPTRQEGYSTSAEIGAGEGTVSTLPTGTGHSHGPSSTEAEMTHLRRFRTV